MRSHEFLSKSNLTEGLMTYPEWAKQKYLDSFFDGLENNQIYAFEYPKGTRFLGIVQYPEQVRRHIVRSGSVKDAAPRLTVEIVDDQTNQPTGEFVDNVPITSIFKDEKIKGELKPNMGNISEALLGCAVAAKFEAGGAIITERQLADMGKRLAQNKGYIETQAGKDTLVFKVSIPFMDTKAFYAWLGEDSRGRTLGDYKVPPESIQLIERRARIAVEYANTSKRVISAVEQARQDPRKNKVDVLSDGGEKENQNTTKVDLKILIDGNETAKRLLSVKAGNVAQFGQVSGVNFEHAQEFFGSVGVTLPDTTKKYFYDIPPNTRGTEKQKEHNFNNGFAVAYQAAFKMLTAKARANDAALVEDVYKGLLTHLTRNEEGVEMVILDPDDKKAFRELSFGPEFKQAMDQLQLVVTESDRAKGYNISIYGFPTGSIAKKYVPSRKDADSKLVDLTTQFKDGSIRNYLNMGSLLKNIADIENRIEAMQQSEPGQQPQVGKPATVATPVATQKPAVKAPAKPVAPAAPVKTRGTVGSTPAVPQTPTI